MQQLQTWLQNTVQLVDSSQSMMNSLDYLRLTGRDEEQIQVVEEYCKENGLFYTADSEDPIYTECC